MIMDSVALVGKDPNATAAHWLIDYKILVVSFSEMHGRRTTPTLLAQDGREQFGKALLAASSLYVACL